MKHRFFIIFLALTALYSTAFGQNQRVADFLSPDSAALRVVDSIYNRLTTQERLGQMIVVAAGEYGRPQDELTALVKDHSLGGIIFLGGTADEFKGIKKGLDSLPLSVPLSYSLDAEPSLLHYKLRNVKSFVKTNALSNVSMVDSVVKLIDSMLHDVGIHINYAPVCDLTPENEVIGHRSFGKSADTVTLLSKAFVESTIKDNILPVVKHFPGHGNVEGDSHKKLVYIDGEMKELSVFASMIDAGCPSVMVGHIAIKNNPYASELPATCSRKAVTDLLRDSLGFDGLVITDALNMGAVVNVKDAGYLAMKAGCDIILMPQEVPETLKLAMEQMKEDELFALQIEKSVKRILLLKYLQGFFNH